MHNVINHRAINYRGYIILVIDQLQDSALYKRRLYLTPPYKRHSYNALTTLLNHCFIYTILQTPYRIIEWLRVSQRYQCDRSYNPTISQDSEPYSVIALMSFGPCKKLRRVIDFVHVCYQYDSKLYTSILIWKRTFKRFFMYTNNVLMPHIFSN